MQIKDKARTLACLKIKGAIVPKLKIYKWKDFASNENKILDDINNNFSKKIAIRSSSKNEDQKKFSNAGKFLSFVNVDSKDKLEIKDKIKKVVNSYKEDLKSTEFFIQKMVNNIKISGVALTRNLEDYSPCININYSIDGDSSIVTSGKRGSKNYLYIENYKYKPNKKFSKLIKIINNIKKITRFKDLDIEFAINQKNKIFILQVRKLIVPEKFKRDKFNQQDLLFRLEKKIHKLQKNHYNLNGKTTFFGVMPDWNPAEIIGIKPKPLALSLYQELITDHIWSENRKIYGYKDLSQFHLMTTFYGTPFIDVRIDFNSWIPNKLPDYLSEKIINFYLRTFKNKKHLHDKVEFEILLTCYSLNTKKKIEERFKNLLNAKEKKLLLKHLQEINATAALQLEKDYKIVNELILKQNHIIKSKLYFIDKIYWLLEDCKKYGTLPFASLARCAFISTEILNSFVEENIITNEERLKFLASIKTIATNLNEDFYYKNKKEFIRKYGHLRPGTYEITSPNYKKNYNNYFSKNSLEKKIRKKANFIFSNKQKKKINKFLTKTKIYKNFEHLISFIKQSIKYREYSKFIFTKSIDEIFDNIEKFGQKFNIKKDDLSYIDINKLLGFYFNFSNFRSIENLKKHIAENKKEYLNNKLINLPDIITSGKDLFIRHQNHAKINFISNKIVTSKIIEFDKINLKSKINSIVCIENADPGYDFLFSKNIKGLITKYGGQNSHMAIRCAELNLPALIGVGEVNYNKIINNKSIRIDCVLKKIEFIN